MQKDDKATIFLAWRHHSAEIQLPCIREVCNQERREQYIYLHFSHKSGRYLGGSGTEIWTEIQCNSVEPKLKLGRQRDVLKIHIGWSTIYTRRSTGNFRSCFNSSELTSHRSVILTFFTANSFHKSCPFFSCDQPVCSLNCYWENHLCNDII